MVLGVLGGQLVVPVAWTLEDDLHFVACRSPDAETHPLGGHFCPGRIPPPCIHAGTSSAGSVGLQQACLDNSRRRAAAGSRSRLRSGRPTTLTMIEYVSCRTISPIPSHSLSKSVPRLGIWCRNDIGSCSASSGTGIALPQPPLGGSRDGDPDIIRQARPVRRRRGGVVRPVGRPAGLRQREGE